MFTPSYFDDVRTREMGGNDLQNYRSSQVLTCTWKEKPPFRRFSGMGVSIGGPVLSFSLFSFTAVRGSLCFGHFPCLDSIPGFLVEPSIHIGYCRRPKEIPVLLRSLSAFLSFSGINPALSLSFTAKAFCQSLPMVNRIARKNNPNMK